MQYTISNGDLQITVDSFGAQLISVKYQGKERLWQNPTGEWGGHAPLLFPVCGHFGVTVAGKSYPICAHGFAKISEFTYVGGDAHSLCFTLTSNEKTKEMYPFDFVFRVTYTIEDGTLSVVYQVENPSSSPLYFACGGHEAFALDADVDEYQLYFEKQQHFLHHFHDGDGYMTGETLDYGIGKTFALPIEFLQKGNTLIFKNVQSNSVTLQKKDATPLVHITFDGFKNLLLWRAENAKFICIEPWTNVPDSADKADIEFSQKEGVYQVAPKQNKTLTRTFTFV